MEARDRSQWEIGDVAVKAFELSQTLKDKWFKADVRAKRQLLDIVCLNLVLNDVTLDATMRKPLTFSPKGLFCTKVEGLHSLHPSTSCRSQSAATSLLTFQASPNQAEHD